MIIKIYEEFQVERLKNLGIKWFDTFKYLILSLFLNILSNHTKLALWSHVKMHKSNNFCTGSTLCYIHLKRQLRKVAPDDKYILSWMFDGYKH